MDTTDLALAIADHIAPLREAAETGDEYRTVFLLDRLESFVRTETDKNRLHRVFGAPGDWGYGTPIGDALLAIYKS